MSAESPTSLDSCTPEGSVPSRLPDRNGWIGWSLVAGLVLAIPFGWMLAYLAALPFMLGLFFFLLLGLVTAATMFRFGRKAPPPSRGGTWVLGTTVSLVIMGTSIWVEYQALHRSVDRVVRNSYWESFTAPRLAEMREGVHAYLAGYLASNYPPGGLIGYVRWACFNGQLTCPRVFKDSTVSYKLPYRQGMWIIRVTLSILLVEWTIMSQMLALRTERPRADLPSEPESRANAM